MKFLGATCEDCIYEAPAKRGDHAAGRKCRQCISKNGRPGFSPKESVVTMQVETVQGPMRRVIHG